MANKEAFVFDTNFIFQMNNLDDVIENLSDRFSVYVTQVSVEERIAQKCRDIMAHYNELDSMKEKYSRIAKISIIKSCDEELSLYRTGMQKKYENAFKEKLIPFSKDGVMLSAILERAYNKRAPFLSDEKASDKGFKDALIWESILKYFKDNGENEVHFITDDGGFAKNAEMLCAEFFEATGKSLSIHPNSYYREILKSELLEESPETIQKTPNIDLKDIRENIKSVISGLCYRSTYNRNWDQVIVNTFSISQQVDADYITAMLERMESVYKEHILETELCASQLLDLDGRFSDGDEKIEISAIEDAIHHRKTIEEVAPDYLNNFYTAVASIINQHYIEKKTVQDPISAEDDLPF